MGPGILVVVILSVLPTLFTMCESCRSGEIYDYDNNVSKYYICRYGVKVPVFCPPDYSYNMKLKDCIRNPVQDPYTLRTVQPGIIIVQTLLKNKSKHSMSTSFKPTRTTPSAPNTTVTVAKIKKKAKKNIIFSSFLSQTTTTPKPVKLIWKKQPAIKAIQSLNDFKPVSTVQNMIRSTERKEKQISNPMHLVTLPYIDWELNDMMRREVTNNE